MENTSECFDAIAQSLERQALTRSDVDGIVQAYGRHIGVDDLALDENGTAQLKVDGEIGLSLAHLPDLPGIVVGTPIGSLPADRPEYLKTALQANMSLDLTRGGVFAMLPGSSEVMLCWFVSLAEPHIDRIDREFAEIVEFARFWEAEFATALRRERETRKNELDVPSHAVQA